MDRCEIYDVAKEYKDCLRDGSNDLFIHLNRLNIPVLVFSAGLGDTVNALLKETNNLLPNVQVIFHQVEKLNKKIIKKIYYFR